MTHKCCRHVGSYGGIRSNDPEFCHRDAKWVDVSKARPRFLCGLHRGSASGFRHTELLPIPIDIWETAERAGVGVFVTRDNRAWEATIEDGEDIRVACVYYTPPDIGFWKTVREDLATVIESKETA